MDSLYGGKPGLSFILKERFSSINEMTAAFERGDGHTTTWYGEYCIIDTPNKNHQDNGKIYRRGVSYTAANGARVDTSECVGQIVGPSSGTPSFCLNSLVDENGNYNLPNEAGVKEEPVEVKIGNSTVTGYIRESSDSKEAAITFKPGVQEGENKATYTWQNIRVDANDKNESNSWFGVQLEIPTLTQAWKAESISAYKQPSTKTESSNNFYQTTTIGVPKGIQGISVTDLKVEELNSSSKSYYAAQDIFNAITKNGIFDTTSIEELTSLKFEEKCYYLTGVITSYQEETPIKYKIVFSSWDVLDNISFNSEDGKITFDYAGEKESQTYYLPYVEKVELTTGTGSKGGQFTCTYPNDTFASANTYWVKNIQINENGQVQYTFAGVPTEEISNSSLLPVGNSQDGIYNSATNLIWPKDITLNKETGELTLTNNQEVITELGQLVFPKSLKIITLENEDEADNQFEITYSDNTKETFYTQQVKKIRANEDGNLVVEYHDGTENEDIITENAPLNTVINLKFEEQESSNDNEENTEETTSTYNLVKEFRYTGKETMLEDVSILKHGDKAIVFNDGETFLTDEDENIISNQPLLTGDRRIKVNYAIPENKEVITEPINSIEDITISKGQVYVLYSNKDLRDQGYIIDDNEQTVIRPGWAKNLNGSFYTSDFAEKAGQTYYWKSIGSIAPAGYQFATTIDINTIIETEKPSGIEGAGDKYQDSLSDIAVYLEKELFEGLVAEENIDIIEKINSGFLVAVLYNKNANNGETSYSKFFFRKTNYSEDLTTYSWEYLGNTNVGASDSNENKNEIGITSYDESGREEDFLFKLVGINTVDLSTALAVDPWLISKS